MKMTQYEYVARTISQAIKAYKTRGVVPIDLIVRLRAINTQKSLSPSQARIVNRVMALL